MSAFQQLTFESVENLVNQHYRVAKNKACADHAKIKTFHALMKRMRDYGEAKDSEMYNILCNLSPDKSLEVMSVINAELSNRNLFKSNTNVQIKKK